ARQASVRLIQLALGGLMSPKAKETVWEGYSAREGSLPPRSIDELNFKKAIAALRSAFPTGKINLDREISRTLAMIQDDGPSLPMRRAHRLPRPSARMEDLHYLIVRARWRGPRPPAVTNKTATALLALDRKISARHLNRDSNWPLRVAELHAELARKDPRLNEAVLAAAEFGRPDRALFTRCPGFDRRRAAEVFWRRAKNVT